jgi:hypothetical protein
MISSGVTSSSEQAPKNVMVERVAMATADLKKECFIVCFLFDACSGCGKKRMLFPGRRKVNNKLF